MVTEHILMGTSFHPPCGALLMGWSCSVYSIFPKVSTPLSLPLPIKNAFPSVFMIAINYQSEIHRVIQTLGGLVIERILVGEGKQYLQEVSTLTL